MTLRETCEFEFQKAHRDAKQHSTLVLTPAAGAGWMLAWNQGSIGAAIGMALSWPGEFWQSKTVAVLNAIKTEEQ